MDPFNIGPFEVFCWPKETEPGKVRHRESHVDLFLWISNDSTLMAEDALTMSLLSGGIGIPFLHYFHIRNRRAFMVTDSFGPSLEEVFVSSGRYFSMQTLLLLGEQLLSRIEFLHTHCISLGTLGPGSFSVGANSWQSHQVLITKFTRSGTSATTDDLLSVGRILCYFYSRSESWDTFEFTTELLPPVLKEYMYSVRGCTHDYNKLRHIFSNALSDFISHSRIGLGLRRHRAPKRSITPNLDGLITQDIENMIKSTKSIQEKAMEEIHNWEGPRVWFHLDRLLDNYMVLVVRHSGPSAFRFLGQLWDIFNLMVSSTTEKPFSIQNSMYQRFFLYFAALAETVPYFGTHWEACLCQVIMRMATVNFGHKNLFITLKAVDYWQNKLDSK